MKVNTKHFHRHKCKCGRTVSGTGESFCHICAYANEPTSAQRKANYTRQLDEANAREFKQQQKMDL